MRLLNVKVFNLKMIKFHSILVYGLPEILCLIQLIWNYYYEII